MNFLPPACRLQSNYLQYLTVVPLGLQDPWMTSRLPSGAIGYGVYSNGTTPSVSAHFLGLVGVHSEFSLLNRIFDQNPLCFYGGPSSPGGEFPNPVQARSVIVIDGN